MQNEEELTVTDVELITHVSADIRFPHLACLGQDFFRRHFQHFRETPVLKFAQAHPAAFSSVYARAGDELGIDMRIDADKVETFLSEPSVVY